MKEERGERYLVIKKGALLYRLAVSQLVYIKANGDYSSVFMRNKENNVENLTIQIGQIEKKIKSQKELDDLARCGRSYIINMDYLSQIDTDKGEMVLSDNAFCRYVIKDVNSATLKQIKEEVEKIEKKRLWFL